MAFRAGAELVNLEFAKYSGVWKDFSHWGGGPCFSVCTPVDGEGESIKPEVGRVPTVEIMFFSPIVQKLILEGEDHKLPDAIRIGAEEGMQDFNTSLKQLIDDGLIDRNTAFSVSPNRDALKMALSGIDIRGPAIL